MKVIDLLNKIANGEEVPTIIKHKHNIWTYRNDVKDYTDETQFFLGEYIFQEDTQKELNDEVEIIEDKKIEKLELYNFNSGNLEMLIEILNELNREHTNKINEIIDRLEKE